MKLKKQMHLHVFVFTALARPIAQSEFCRSPTFHLTSVNKDIIEDNDLIKRVYEESV